MTIVKLEDIEALSAKAAQGLPLSDEEVQLVERWYGTLNTPDLAWMTERLNAYVLVAAARELTDSEAKHVRSLAEGILELAEIDDLKTHPLTLFLAAFVKNCRSTPVFKVNWSMARIGSIVDRLYALINKR